MLRGRAGGVNYKCFIEEILFSDLIVLLLLLYIKSSNGPIK